MCQNRSPGRTRAGAGFTLLEVLVAFVILALSLGAVYQAFGVGARNARAAEAYTVAALLAESQLAAAGIETPLLSGVLAGEFGAFHWRQTVTPAGGASESGAPAGAQAQLYDIVVTVTWGGGVAPRAVTLRTQRLGEPES